jgi:hypothetical protein
MNAINQKELGLYQKFHVTRTDGKDAPGEKHHGDEYFVLNLTTDKHAMPALAKYAEACADEYPRLADELRGKIVAYQLEKSDYIVVPQVTLPNGTIVPSFKVGKYLSSRGPMGTPISISTENPWVEISYHEAINAAESNALDLLKETQALAIAYDISQQDINWTGGKVGVGSIFQGLHKGNASKAYPANITASTDPEERRWHELSNGQRIHDFAGNAFTWVFDDVQGDEKGLCTKIAADSISLTTAPYPSREKGMGWRPDGACDWSGYALIRGGCWCSGSNAGVFHLSGDWPDNRSDNVGFRCTKGF